ncbi:MAG: hypothetical protein U0802_19150 [Candidatus Binatia bacterium]
MRLSALASLTAAALVAVLPWALFYSRVMQGAELSFQQLLRGSGAGGVGLARRRLARGAARRRRAGLDALRLLVHNAPWPSSPRRGAARQRPAPAVVPWWCSRSPG